MHRQQKDAARQITNRADECERDIYFIFLAKEDDPNHTQSCVFGATSID